MEKKTDKLPEKRPTLELKLTQSELVHIRDLFGIMLPPDLKTTLSQALAESEGRSLVETNLWNKIVSACNAAGVPVGDDSPDFVVSSSGPPPLAIFQLDSSGKDPHGEDPDEPEEEEGEAESEGEAEEPKAKKPTKKTGKTLFG
jgi:hypothetical protein